VWVPLRRPRNPRETAGAGAGTPAGGPIQKRGGMLLKKKRSLVKPLWEEGVVHAGGKSSTHQFGRKGGGQKVQKKKRGGGLKGGRS